MKSSLRYLHTLGFIALVAALIFCVAGCGSAVTAASAPAPIATTLTASSVPAGSGPTTLTVTGSNFVSGAVVNVNSAGRATTFISATQLTVTILASDLATAGTLSVTVTNPAQGGTSNALTLTVTALPGPIATALTPASVVVGSGAITLTVTGSNFVSGAVVNFNGTPRTTTFVSATQLTAAILASDTATIGTATVTVTNPSSGGTSNSLTFTVTATAAPIITALTPASVVVGSSAFTLTVTGSNYVSGAVVNFNGTPRTTTFVSATQLTAAILASDVAAVGTAPVSVTNPASGGTSNALIFTIASTQSSGVAFTGTVKSGTQPLAGSSVQLYAAGATGNGSAPTALLSAALTSDASGNFSVPAGYICPLPASQLYAVARGGSIGAASANSVIAFITSLGACNQLVGSSHIVINEVTTAATAWALSQFLTPTGNIGASATNTVGLANAFATAASLANPITGTSPGVAFPTNGTSPAAKINTLANLLNTCTSAAASSTACTTLLGSSQDTLAATLRIVRNPGSNVAALYTQSATSTAFSPVLTTAPSDWTLFIKFTGGGLFEPSSLGVDANGNIWVASYAIDNSSGSLGLATKFSPIGQPLFPNGLTGSGLNNIYGLAVDASNNAWLANQQSPGSVNAGLGSITVFNSSGQAISGANGYSAGGLNFPTALAIDPDTSVWAVDYGNSRISRLSSSGTPLSGPTGYGAPSIAFPVAIAVDASHNAWIGDQNDGIVTRISSDGTQITPFSCCDEPNSLAIDQSGNVWAANFGGNSVSEISSAGVILSNGAYTGNGNFKGPQGIAIDGVGSVWVGNFHAGYLTQLAGAASTNPAPGQPLSPAAGWAPDANLAGPYAIAIDASGNLWVSNFHSSSIEEFVGLAAPLKTPLIGLPQAP